MDKVNKRERVQDPSSPFTRHLVAISASHRKGRPCLAGAPGSGSSSLPVLQKQQSSSALHSIALHYFAVPCSAVRCSAAHPSLRWAVSSSRGSGAHTPADRQRRAQSNFTFLLSVPAKKCWERKDRGREQRAALIEGWLMVLLWDALQSLSSRLLSLHSPPMMTTLLMSYTK